jgi:hypothetical protein
MEKEKTKRKFSLKTVGIITAFVISINGLSDNLEDWYDRLFTDRSISELPNAEPHKSVDTTRTVVPRIERKFNEGDSKIRAVQSN